MEFSRDIRDEGLPGKRLPSVAKELRAATEALRLHRNCPKNTESPYPEGQTIIEQAIPAGGCGMNGELTSGLFFIRCASCQSRTRADWTSPRAVANAWNSSPYAGDLRPKYGEWKGKR